MRTHGVSEVPLLLPADRCPAEGQAPPLLGISCLTTG